MTTDMTFMAALLIFGFGFFVGAVFISIFSINRESEVSYQYKQMKEWLTNVFWHAKLPGMPSEDLSCLMLQVDNYLIYQNLKISEMEKHNNEDRTQMQF